MSKSNDASAWYATTFKQWPKQVGAKPTAEALDTIHKLGYRPGKQALFAALCLRPEGCTGQQMMLACSNAQLVKTFGKGGTVDKGLAKRLPTAKTPENHVVYRIELTPRGLAKVAKAGAATEAIPAKAVKARKPKAEKPVDVQPVAMPVTEPVAEQPQAQA